MTGLVKEQQYQGHEEEEDSDDDFEEPEITKVFTRTNFLFSFDVPFFYFI